MNPIQLLSDFPNSSKLNLHNSLSKSDLHELKQLTTIVDIIIRSKRKETASQMTAAKPRTFMPTSALRLPTTSIVLRLTFKMPSVNWTSSGTTILTLINFPNVYRASSAGTEANLQCLCIVLNCLNLWRPQTVLLHWQIRRGLDQIHPQPRPQPRFPDEDLLMLFSNTVRESPIDFLDSIVDSRRLLTHGPDPADESQWIDTN